MLFVNGNLNGVKHDLSLFLNAFQSLSRIGLFLPPFLPNVEFCGGWWLCLIWLSSVCLQSVTSTLSC